MAQVWKWRERLKAEGWPEEFFEIGHVAANVHGGREGHGVLAICTPGVAIAFDGMLGRLVSEQRFPWNTMQWLDASGESGGTATFMFGRDTVDFLSDRTRLLYSTGPQRDITDSVRPHLPKDGWDGRFKWSVHHVTKTKEQLLDFLLSFVVSSSAAEWQKVPADQVAVRCVEVLGREGADGLLQALDLLEVADRVAALDTLPSLQDTEKLLIQMRWLAGEFASEERIQELTDTRSQLVAALREALA